MAKLLLYFTIIYFSTINVICNDTNSLDFNKLDRKFVKGMKTFDIPSLRPKQSGYLNVSSDEDKVENLFWQLYESKTVDPKIAPLMIWGCGGPGASDQGIIFGFVGPTTIDNQTRELKENKYGFNQFANQLIVDWPLGVGYSINTNKKDAKKNISTDMHIQQNRFITRWMQKHAEYYNNDLYLTGDSFFANIATQSYYLATKSPKLNPWLKVLKGFLFDGPCYADRILYTSQITNSQMFHLLNKKNLKKFQKTVETKIKFHNPILPLTWVTDVTQILNKLPRYAPYNTNYYDARIFAKKHSAVMFSKFQFIKKKY